MYFYTAFVTVLCVLVWKTYLKQTAPAYIVCWIVFNLSFCWKFHFIVIAWVDNKLFDQIMLSGDWDFCAVTHPIRSLSQTVSGYINSSTVFSLLFIRYYAQKVYTCTGDGKVQTFKFEVSLCVTCNLVTKLLLINLLSNKLIT